MISINTQNKDSSLLELAKRFYESLITHNECVTTKASKERLQKEQNARVDLLRAIIDRIRQDKSLIENPVLMAKCILCENILLNDVVMGIAYGKSLKKAYENVNGEGELLCYALVGLLESWIKCDQLAKALKLSTTGHVRPSKELYTKWIETTLRKGTKTPRICRDMFIADSNGTFTFCEIKNGKMVVKTSIEKDVAMKYVEDEKLVGYDSFATGYATYRTLASNELVARLLNEAINRT